MEVAARAEARPGLVLLTHADVDILQRQVHALRGQGQQPVLQLRQHAPCRTGCKGENHVCIHEGSSCRCKVESGVMKLSWR